LVMGHSIRHDPMAVKSVLGFVPQEIALYEDLTARENLTFWGKMYNLRGRLLQQRVEEVLEVISLTDRANDRVGKFSGGMKRRVNIGVALLHRPQVIYMDEPTVGIDPQSRRNILDSVLALKAKGLTVLYTTHYMEEAQELSDHIAIMDHGLLRACGTNAELVTLVGQADSLQLTLSVENQALIETWRTIPGVQQVDRENGNFHLLVDDSNQILPRLFETANTHGVRITGVDIRTPNLESVFLHLTGRALRDG
jgi:ABC-2 type transport system ATP-binding protein